MPRLVIKHGKGVGRDHALGGGPCIVGRDAASAQFVLDDHLVSRQHFQVVPDGGAWFVEDMGSTNGTLVNGQRAKRMRLNDGDLIQVGATRVTFVQKDILGGLAAPTPSRRKRRPSSAGSGRPAAAPVPVRRKGKAASPSSDDKKGPTPPVRRKKHLR